MLPALYDGQRRTLLRLAYVCCVLSLGVLPLTGGVSTELSAATIVSHAATEEVSAPEKLQFPSFSFGRDPFVPEVVDSQRDANSPGVTTPIVSAIITGSQPRALLETAGAVRMIAPGDRVGNAVVLSIDASGVVLTGGIRLPIAPEKR